MHEHTDTERTAYTALTGTRVALVNVTHRPARTAALVIIVSFIAFILSGGTLMSISLHKGLARVQSRLGADLIVVPEGSGGKMESILLSGEPQYFYLDRKIERQLRSIAGIDRITSQFYLTSISESCCSMPVQIIGFDPDTDFSIQPWIQKVIKGKLADGMVLAGSDISLSGTSLTFFGTSFPVAAQLARTGSGLDHAVFANMNTLEAMSNAAQERHIMFIGESNPVQDVSSVLLKVAVSEDATAVAQKIARTIPGVQVVQTESIIATLARNLDGFRFFLHLFIILFFIIAFVILTLSFAITINERKKECATMRIIGASRHQLAALLLKEALLISSAGGIIGTTLAFLVFSLFSLSIEQRLGLPYINPSIASGTALLFLSLAVTAACGPLASMVTVLRQSKAEIYTAFKEGE